MRVLLLRAACLHHRVPSTQQANCPGLVVVSEDDHRPLLLHRIAKDDIYHRRAGASAYVLWDAHHHTYNHTYKRTDDTIITWSDTNMGTDIALSFAEDMGCNLIWYAVCTFPTDASPPCTGTAFSACSKVAMAQVVLVALCTSYTLCCQQIHPRVAGLWTTSKPVMRVRVMVQCVMRVMVQCVMVRPPVPQTWLEGGRGDPFHCHQSTWHPCPSLPR